jgi:Type II secretion system (T2SS), protein E, N-terminal domain
MQFPSASVTVLFDLPPLDFPVHASSTWPASPALEESEHCRIATRAGSVVMGDVSSIDFAAGTMLFRTRADGPAVRLTFSRVRWIRLSALVTLAARRHMSWARGAVDSAKPARFSLEWAEADESSWQGETLGHVETAEGLFLYLPVDDGAALERLFVPRSAYRSWSTGATTRSRALTNGISTLEKLLDALDDQAATPTLRIGQSLVDLGFLSKDELDAALSEKSPTTPLGEKLVSAGTISRPDLMTALAYKMGYPFVDLSTFPIDHAAAKLLPRALASELCSLPIARDSTRLIVVMDRPGSSARLRARAELAAYDVVIAIAPAWQIAEVIAELPDPM